MINWHRVGGVCALSAACLVGCSSVAAVSATETSNAAAPATERDERSGWERVSAYERELRRVNVGGTLRRVRWNSDEPALYASRGDDRLRVDLVTYAVERIDPDDEPPRVRDDARRGGRGGRPARGQQRARETAPDASWVAICEDWNVRIERPESSDEPMETIHVTEDGTRKLRYGRASWVYGEELGQTTAMWWAPDSSALVYYAFDERHVPDFHLLDDLEQLRPSVAVEGYPKPGEANPVASLHLFDLATRTSRPLYETTLEDDVYIYHVRFTPDGSAVLLNRTNRLQNELDVVRVDLNDGAAQIVVSEAQPTWQENRPLMQFLEDGARFIWASEASGYRHFELRHLDGRHLATLSADDADVISIIDVDETTGRVLYTQYDPAAPLDMRVMAVNLDGAERRVVHAGAGRVTVSAAPDGAHLLVREESITDPPATWLVPTDGGGERVLLAAPDLDAIADFGAPAPERLVATAADGTTTIYGWLHKPRGFDPAQSYPLLIDVYGGPESRGVTNRYAVSQPGCGAGFLVAKFDNRGTSGRGKAFMGAVYEKLGIVDIADQVAGVESLLDRPYVDASRVGIYGHSYGGYMAALAILKYPEVFAAASAGAPVTDWRNYDTIYTERYMGLPQENPDGYDDGSCMTYADQLEGRLLILHGMMDDNVHPTNAWQLVHELQGEGKVFDMMFYPTRGHGLGQHASAERWDFLVEALGE